ncbi:MAG: carboxymuconolactone decarboxylase family protein [Gammaproteobacteria bacterium]|nr:carboxymuconolactone decarboxylase family protein [Gammaproteobacteria bacterium]MBU2056568.1 carboxymuconolactone decarboxylase family protein [Gammaproteobacteria bacterium]MBU2173626.1 carboxymuconolactone decarboxylase family protein [Gammaproteobacteria bacterium]MBU2246602.1 carboxymuconolactone decarboxylase family protein [Gammaproteobacteria bacterium]MBU2344506.1 carboxymuconolactone decarboxylase family protein [Gammaproteobacteria bacterium]
MSERISRTQVYKSQPAIVQHLVGLAKAAEDSGLDKSLIHLMKIRASQLNGCAFCQHMHASEARKEGERQDRLDVLPAWQEVKSAFTAREQAALLWTEALTLVADKGVSDQDYAAVAAQYSEQEILNLTALIVTINSWNRIAVAFHFQPEF